MLIFAMLRDDWMRRKEKPMDEARLAADIALTESFPLGPGTGV